MTYKFDVIKAILEPDWTPDRDTSHETKSAYWIQHERVKAIREVIYGD